MAGLPRRRRRILTGDFQFKAALSVLKFARALELSTDRLAAFGHLFREHLARRSVGLTMAGQNSAKSLSLAEPLSTWKARCPEKLEMHVTKIPGLGISGNTTPSQRCSAPDCDTKRVGASLPMDLPD
jgi:hypothetical protein